MLSNRLEPFGHDLVNGGDGWGGDCCRSSFKNIVEVEEEEESFEFSFKLICEVKLNAEFPNYPAQFHESV